MSTTIEVPQIGESISSGILAVWLRKDGDTVAEGDELFELETDKATLAVPSPGAGVLRHDAREGDEVTVGEAVGRIEPADGGSAADAGSPGGSPAAAAGSAPATPPADTATTAADHGESTLSPAVRRIVTERGLDPSTITGTGPKGRITKEDALAAAEAAAGKGGAAGTAPAESRDAGAARTAGRPAGPSAAGASKPSTGAGVGTPGMPAALAAPSMPTNDRQRRVPLSNLRKRIAENLVYSRQTSAHVTTFNEVDMSAVMDLRARHKEIFQERHGVRLGFMSFFVKASQTALEAFPEVNAYLDGTDVLYNDYVNIGVALSSEKGLLTPVIKDVSVRSFADIERQIVDFMTRANDRKLKPDEMVGATFTISNGGVFGSLLSTPIPSPPQTAVLGMHAIQKRPVVVGDQIVIRPMMYLALTYDHRMIDGREAVQFLGMVKNLIEDPSRLLLGL
jgi:2-oxoglutarate dehydrogenase E2 component (dihydrolipoamide succinyltransferase)